MKKLIHAVVAVTSLSGLSGCITAAQQIAAAQDRTCQQWVLILEQTPTTPIAGLSCPGNKLRA
jgi:hypothetical protein